MSTFKRQLGITLIAAGIAGVVLIVLFRFVQPAQTTSRPVPLRVSCYVRTVYDGDTIGCDLNDNGEIENPEEHIRLLGIDTPEMHYSLKKQKNNGGKPVTDEPYAKEAGDYVETVLLRQVAYLEFDIKRRDRYGRTLAYVYPSARSRVSVPESLLRQGLARTSFFEPNMRYKNLFLEAEAAARQHQRGIWTLPTDG